MDPIAKCPHCGMIHPTQCPKIKAYEYHPDGTVKRVEFFAPNDYAPLYAGAMQSGFQPVHAWPTHSNTHPRPPTAAAVTP